MAGGKRSPHAFDDADTIVCTTCAQFMISSHGSACVHEIRLDTRLPGGCPAGRVEHEDSEYLSWARYSELCFEIGFHGREAGLSERAITIQALARFHDSSVRTVYHVEPLPKRREYLLGRGSAERLRRFVYRVRTTASLAC